MNYTRAYWVFFLGAGVLFLLLSVLDYLAIGDVTLRVGISLAFGLVVVGVSTYAVRYPDRAGGPTELGLRFAIAVATFLLLVGLTIDRLLGG